MITKEETKSKLMRSRVILDERRAAKEEEPDEPTNHR